MEVLPDYQLKIADLYNIEINKQYYIWKSNGKLNSNLCVCVCVQIIFPSCWFSLNRSETVKAVTLAFCSIQ